MAKKEDVLAIVVRLKGLVSEPLRDNNPTFSQSPAVKVINSVLSLGMNYKTVVEPKLNAFAERHPDVKQVSELAIFIKGYPTPIDFLNQEFNYKHKNKSIMKANAIHAVVEYLCGIIEASSSVPEEEMLRQWAVAADPGDYRSLNIKGFKRDGFQWLRMLFGADTVKPDRHIKNFLFETLNREVPGMEAIELIEEAAAHSGYSARAVDAFIWKIMSQR